jgi:hypothetical protein
MDLIRKLVSVDKEVIRKRYERRAKKEGTSFLAAIDWPNTDVTMSFSSTVMFLAPIAMASFMAIPAIIHKFGEAGNACTHTLGTTTCSIVGGAAGLTASLILSSAVVAIAARSLNRAGIIWELRDETREREIEWQWRNDVRNDSLAFK